MKWIKTEERQPDTDRIIVVKIENAKTREYFIREGFYCHRRKEFISTTPATKFNFKIVAWIEMPDD